MSADTTASSEQQLQHLLDIVEQNRERRCAELLDKARAEARALLQRARRDARARMHGKVLEIRDKTRQQLAADEARRQTRLRRQRHNADRDLLARAWQPMVDMMRRRWQQEDSRALWTERLVTQALERLVERRWHIEHPAGWPEPERDRLAARLGAELETAPLFSASAEIEAGLRIRAGSTCIDGTLAGLLSSRARIEALMLAVLNDCRSSLANAVTQAPDRAES